MKIFWLGIIYVVDFYLYIRLFFCGAEDGTQGRGRHVSCS